MLHERMRAEGLPLGLVTYASCGVEAQRVILAENPASPMHFTGSREVAAAIKEVLPKLIASTGGPNTRVATAFTDEVAAAVRMSTLIENSGQCTAMRHFVVPGCSEDDIKERVFGGVARISEPKQALQVGYFLRCVGRLVVVFGARL
jgi:acyl-CoA reductase-like NAD-dependent aldehyde dehydrogenase